jgi:hypothetical protein
VVIATLGLLALAVSLAGGSGEGSGGATFPILLWLSATAALALAVLLVGRMVVGVAAAEGAAAGLFFSLGDISTKLAT